MAKEKERLLFPDDLPSGKLSQIFNHTTTSYKLYWFWSILDLIKQRPLESIFTFDEIIRGMLEKVWYPSVYFHLNFGKLDRLSDVIFEIKHSLSLPDNELEIIRKIQSFYESGAKNNVSKEIEKFQKYVPFRLLSPWFSGLDNDDVVKSANQSFQNHSNLPLYRFRTNDGKIAESQASSFSIEIQPRWKAFLLQNYILIEEYTLWNLTEYLQKKNPNIPAIQNKLRRPISRNLSSVRKFFYHYLSKHPAEATCIYSGQSFSLDSFAVDHFIPWSYVTHDQVWNLIPTVQEINSKKSNSLPDARFIEPMILRQMKVRDFAIENRYRFIAEDFDVLGIPDRHSKGSEAVFKEKLSDTFSTQLKIARNSGFPIWHYP
ncbi:MAG: hypothetical protein KDK41_14025 [Leptospiraceae bacterium]|nr:hypothetical protein [Leptospiraceae bacterium]